MVRKAFKPEQIINKLREAEVLLSQGSTVEVKPVESWESPNRPITAGVKNTAVCGWNRPRDFGNWRKRTPA